MASFFDGFFEPWTPKIGPGRRILVFVVFLYCVVGIGAVGVDMLRHNYTISQARPRAQAPS